jgi:hypothetical protein
MRRLLMFTIALSLLAGCDSQSPTPIPEVPPTALTTPTALSTPVPLPTPAVTERTDERLIAAFENAGVPMRKVEVYNEDSDPNKLMGKAFQYIEKASWQDDRIPDDGNGEVDVSEGGSIEVFATEEDATARKDYIENIGRSMPMLVENTYQKGSVLLRLSKEFTRAQVDEYKRVTDQTLSP